MDLDSYWRITTVISNTVKSKDLNIFFWLIYLICRAGRNFEKFDTYKVTFKEEKEAKPALGFTCAISRNSEKDT